MRTMQEYFNEKAEYLLSSRFVRSVKKNGGCRYRLDSTATCPTRCVVGMDIPDEKYEPRFDDMSLIELVALLPEIACVDWDMRAGGKSLDDYFLRRMQGVHDIFDASDIAGRRQRLQQIAEDSNLDITVLKV